MANRNTSFTHLSITKLLYEELERIESIKDSAILKYERSSNKKIFDLYQPWVIVGFLSTFIIPWIFVDLVAGVIGLTSWLIGAFSIYVLIECDFKFSCANLMLREKDEKKETL